MATTLTPALYHLRPISPRDYVGLMEFYAALSPASRAARLHGAAPCLPDATTMFLCGPDHQHREGIVAECRDATGHPVIIGHICIDPTGNDVAEMAIAVADAWQGQGLGRAMLAQAIIWAKIHGITRLAASILCSNAAMFSLLRSMRYPMTYGPLDGDTSDVLLDVLSPRPVAA